MRTCSIPWLSNRTAPLPPRRRGRHSIAATNGIFSAYANGLFEDLG